MNSKVDTLAQAYKVARPSMVANEQVSHQEVSHVFYCMQCDLQFQIDMAVTSRNGSHELDAGIIRVRLDPRIGLERKEELH